jgi:hypothetical protein
MTRMIILFFLASSIAANAQGISNARDGNGNLVERGAATRTYPSRPMANNSNPTISPPPQVNVMQPTPYSTPMPALTDPGSYWSPHSRRR